MPNVLSAQEKKRRNDLNGLSSIYRFGWLRAREIGNILWPGNPTRHVAGATIARRWLKERYVMSRTLPWGRGLAFVLTKRGADYLDNQFGYRANSGKKIGDHIEQVEGFWRPSNSWEHDLVANSFLTMCMAGGREVKTELELSRAFPNAKKIPDGLWKNEDGHWLGIEVERSNKWSTHHRQLVSSLIDTAAHGLELGEIMVKSTCLVYADPNEIDQGGQAPPDHFARAARAAEALLEKGKEFLLIGLPVKLHNGAVVDIGEIQSKIVGASYAAHLRKSLLGQSWFQSDGFDGPSGPIEVFTLIFTTPEPKPPFHLGLERHKNNRWMAKIFPTDELRTTEEPKILTLNEAPISEVAAKRKALEVLLNTPMYQRWFRNRFYHEGEPPVLSIDDL